MTNVSDVEFVGKVLEATQRGRIDWQKTAVEAQYASTFGGKWTVLIDRGTDHRGNETFWLSLQNAEGETVLRIEQDSRLSGLFELARRYALKVNEAMADFLKELES
jgi:hypothetical protein